MGWDCTYGNYSQIYEELVTSESPFTIDLEFNQIGTSNFDLTAEVTATDNLPNNSNKIFFVITNWVEYSTENPWFYLVVAKSDEQDVNLVDQGDAETYSTELNVALQPDWSVEDLHAVAIIQSWDNQKILQAAQVEFTPTGSNDIPELPSNVTLHQNYPNPFNTAAAGTGRSSTTNISFDLTKDTNVQLNVYNIKGQKVKTLVDAHRTAGSHSIVWHGKNDKGKDVPSGIYYYSLEADSDGGGRYTSVKKMILLK